MAGTRKNGRCMHAIETIDPSLLTPLSNADHTVESFNLRLPRTCAAAGMRPSRSFRKPCSRSDAPSGSVVASRCISTAGTLRWRAGVPTTVVPSADPGSILLRAGSVAPVALQPLASSAGPLRASRAALTLPATSLKVAPVSSLGPPAPPGSRASLGPGRGLGELDDLRLGRFRIARDGARQRCGYIGGRRLVQAQEQGFCSSLHVKRRSNKRSVKLRLLGLSKHTVQVSLPLIWILHMHAAGPTFTEQLKVRIVMLQAAAQPD